MTDSMMASVKTEIINEKDDSVTVEDGVSYETPRFANA